MASTTIPSSGLSGNRHSGAISGRWPGDSLCPRTAATVGSESLGAYRSDPSSHDPAIPDSDPRSPRYEPPHLRHQPGDTWVIDRNRPHDPLDPGPYGSPGWYPDERTGRHRRGELPDDLGPEATQPTRPPASEPTRRPSVPGPVLPPTAATGEPQPIRPVFRPSPERKSVPPGFSADPSPEEPEPEAPNPPRRYRWQDSSEQDQYNFGKLREEAWIGFLEGSQQLHDAHFERSISLRERFALAVQRLVGLVLRVFRVAGRVGDRAEVESGRVMPVSRRVAVQTRPKPSPGPRGQMGGQPRQGARRPLPVSSFVLDWERHFDASQAFREAVTL